MRAGVLIGTGVVSAVRGQKRIRVLMKRGGAAMVEQMKKLIEDSLLTDVQHQHPEERGQ